MVRLLERKTPMKIFDQIPLETGAAYAGIGAQVTPLDICQLMSRIAAALSIRGLVLRSGGADGADTAFAHGALLGPKSEIFTPWYGFNNVKPGIPLRGSPFEAPAMALAERHHPYWDKLSHGARLLQARNCQQVLGRDLQSPSAFVLCWTADGTIRGGTGQAMRVANAMGVPVFNLFFADVRAAIQRRLSLD